jgi:2-oxoglutarate dehydrogenase E1 component
MAHRGRLSTLAHIMGKPYAHILSEFEGKAYDGDGLFDGDVKYHLGYSQKQKADSGARSDHHAGAQPLSFGGS